jgi:hypothetical protein
LSPPLELELPPELDSASLVPLVLELESPPPPLDPSDPPPELLLDPDADADADAESVGSSVVASPELDAIVSPLALLSVAAAVDEAVIVAFELSLPVSSPESSPHATVAKTKKPKQNRRFMSRRRPTRHTCTPRPKSVTGIVLTPSLQSSSYRSGKRSRASRDGWPRTSVVAA